jgi:GNAT superfamily N-acetyltransferase
MMLRRATTGDLPALVGLQRAAYARNRAILGVEPIPLQADYADILATMEVWLAEGRQGLDGALILEPRRDDLLIWSIATEPGRQSAGLGRDLLAFAEHRARSLGLATMRLYTGTPLTHLVAWYGRHGYRTERIEKLPDRSITHMVKRLAA